MMSRTDLVAMWFDGHKMQKIGALLVLICLLPDHCTARLAFVVHYTKQP
jgi:hypothetical protein